MNNKYIQYTSAFALLFLIACGTSSKLVSTTLVDGAVDNAKNCLKDSPKWVMTPGSNNAVGIGKSTDLSFSRTKARTDAVAQLAAKIDTKVQAQLDQLIADQGSEFARATKQAISATVSTTINLFDIKQYYLCPEMIGGKEGYQSFALLNLDAEKMIARLGAATDKLRAETKEDGFKSLLDSFDSRLDTVFD
jgi:hypothetical protein